MKKNQSLSNNFSGNPLLNQDKKKATAVKRRWDDDVVFKNCARQVWAMYGRLFRNFFIRNQRRRRTLSTIPFAPISIVVSCTSTSNNPFLPPICATTRLLKKQYFLQITVLNKESRFRKVWHAYIIECEQLASLVWPLLDVAWMLAPLSALSKHKHPRTSWIPRSAPHMLE